ncbi:hypothetical protein [Yinghuangia seranimata]|uniref:hypothetical protein n=1 Tax=Yinghuangia seranimata TaxID=408067 RepID=UPI00248BD804|nr:hypothetical protein [Yinghuangia seranimata]MDI2127628.1 hypothetical protein [Yinghuangia seranimata]
MNSVSAEAPDHAAYFVAAFPGFLAADVLGVASAMPPHRLKPVEPFPVDVQGERVAIPGRRDADTAAAVLVQHLTLTAAALTHDSGQAIRA